MDEYIQKLNKTSFEIKYSEFPLLTDKKKSSDSFLISHKSFLEIILNQIKASQNYSLSNCTNIKTLKQNLKNLNENLKNLENGRKKTKEYMENKIKNKKIEIQNKLYNKSNDNNTTTYNHYNSIDDIKYFKNNQEEQIDYLNEIPQLKLLSFKLENEINQIDFEFSKKLNMVLNLKIARLYQEEDLEIPVETKKLKSQTTHLMKQNLKDLKQILISTIKTNLNNNMKQKKLQEKINELKLNLAKKKKHKQYLRTNNTITEEEKNNTTRSYDSSDNEYCKRKSVYKRSSNCCKGEILDFDIDEISEKINNKVWRSLSNKIVKRKNVQFFNNNLNLNINLNLNFNNFKIIKENINEDKSCEKFVNQRFFKE